MSHIQYRPVIHFESFTEKGVRACRPIAMVISRDPQEVTCPQCQEDLRRLEALLDALMARDA
jgi:hypothetical protein